jgi:superfamily II DNA or RNA helicase
MSESTLELRPYQEDAVQAALRMKKSTVKAPTGTGKTIIAIAWLERIAKDCLIIVPTQALIYQAWTPKLQAYGFSDVGQYYAFAKVFGPVTVTTFSSAVSHPELLDAVDVVVLDEVHHLGAKTALKRLLPKLKQKEYVLGISSVPERPDLAHELFLKEFPICYDLSLGSAMKQGFVSPIEVFSRPAAMTSEERTEYLALTSKIKRAFSFCGPNLARWSRCYNPKTKEYIGRQGIWAMSKRKRVLSDVATKREEVFKIVSDHPEDRIILFSESVIAIENIREYLVERGISCETFHSKIEPYKRMEILDRWGVDFQVLLSVRALEEGLDVKEVRVGILITSGRNKRQYIQRIGRIIRPMEGKTATFYVIYCPDTVEETYSSTIEKILRTA